MNDNNGINTSIIFSHVVPNEIWIKTFSFLDVHDILQSIGLVNRSFLALSSDDFIWSNLCRIRWRGKQNVRRFEVDAPVLNKGVLKHEPLSWKEAYFLAEIDSRRQSISRDEISYFQWKLIYDGAPSRMGLRQFDRNGTYSSPYIGVCEWILHGDHLMFAGMALPVQRDSHNWGWVIGRGQRTEYWSVEVEVSNESNAI